MAVMDFQCGCCNELMSGYSKNELVSDGWTFHAIKGTEDFALCLGCNEMFDWRRKARAAEIAA